MRIPFEEKNQKFLIDKICGKCNTKWKGYIYDICPNSNCIESSVNNQPSRCTSGRPIGLWEEKH